MPEEEKTQAVELKPETEIAYYFDDKNLGERFPVLDAKAGTWWMDGGTRLELLMAQFRQGCTVIQACYLAGITYHQYKHFRMLHPWLVHAITVYKSLVPLKLKEIILRAAIGDKDHKPNAKMALGAYHIFEAPETDPDFAVQATGLVPVGAEQVATLVQRAYTDKDGKILVTTDSIEIVKRHADG